MLPCRAYGTEDGAPPPPPRLRPPPVPAEPFRGATAPPERREGFGEIHEVAELEEGVPGMVGQRRPGIGMQHSMDDRAVSSGRLSPDSTAGDAKLRFAERNEFAQQANVLMDARATL